MNRKGRDRRKHIRACQRQILRLRQYGHHTYGHCQQGHDAQKPGECKIAHTGSHVHRRHCCRRILLSLRPRDTLCAWCQGPVNRVCNSATPLGTLARASLVENTSTQSINHFRPQQRAAPRERGAEMLISHIQKGSYIKHVVGHFAKLKLCEILRPVALLRQAAEVCNKSSSGLCCACEPRRQTCSHACPLVVRRTRRWEVAILPCRDAPC